MKKLFKILILCMLIILFRTHGITQTMCGSSVLYENYSDVSIEETGLLTPNCPEIDSDFSCEIPVMVHALYNNGFENVEYEDVVSMIETANNQLITESVSGFNVSITLKLVENGTCTPGFDRLFFENASYTAISLQETKDEDMRIKGESIIQWPADKYLNIWITESINTGQALEGFAWTTFDFAQSYGDEIIDGIVLDDDYLDSFIHEFGHYVGLYHLWEEIFSQASNQSPCEEGANPDDWDCTHGDLIADTRPVKGGVSGFFNNRTCEEILDGLVLEDDFISCYPIPNSGGGGYSFYFPVDNYMTYYDRCWSRFTEIQYSRIVYDLKARRLALINNNEQLFVDLSSEEDHSVDDLLLALGLENIEELCSYQDNYSIVLGGNLILDSGPENTIYFNNGTTINMKQNAKITVKNNTTFDLDNVHIFGCDFWEHIYVESGSSLNISNNTLIEDGINAVKAEKGANINIDNSIFNNNLCSISLFEDGEGDQTNLILTKSTITSDESFFWLSWDIAFGRPTSGINIYGQENINLRTDKENRNTFKRLGNGIVINRGSAFVENAFFEDIFPAGVSGNYGNIVYRDGYAVNTKNGGTTKVQTCNISNARYGIGGANSYIDIKSCDIRDTEQGILLYKMKHSLISECDIESYERCVYNGFSEQQYYFNLHNIKNSYLTIKGNGDNAKAVEIESCEAPKLINNRIYIQDNDAGFYCIASKYNNLTSNTITIINEPSSTNTNGIFIDESQEYYLEDNYIFNLSSKEYNNGIYIKNSTSARYECNKIDDFGQGMHFIGACDKSTLKKNIYNDNEYDVLLGIQDLLNSAEGETVIGTQFSSDNESNSNKWPTDENLAYNSATMEKVLWSQFIVNSIQDDDYIPEYVESAHNEWFDDVIDYNNIPDCDGFIGSTLFPKILNCYEIISKIEAIDTSRNMDICKKWVWKYQYFKELLKLREKNLLTDDCLNYLSNQNNIVLIQIANVSNAINSIEVMQSGGAEFAEEMINLSSILDSLYNVGNIFTSEWNQTISEYSSVNKEYQSIMDVERNRDFKSIDNVKNEILRISIPDSCLRVLLEVYTIKLNLIKSDTLTPSELTYLRDIAFRCNDHDGEEVAIARSMLSLYENNRYTRLEECISDEIIPRNFISIENKTKKLLVYPNPTTDEFSIFVKLDKNEIGKAEILDIGGNLKNSYIIDNNSNGIKVDTKLFSPGVYFIKYISNDGKEKIEKLIISK